MVGFSNQPCRLEEISIPDSVRELCEGCFKGCESLRRVTFGPSSSLERSGADCFYGCGLVRFEIPASVRAIGGGAFGECALTGIVCFHLVVCASASVVNGSRGDESSD